MATFFCFSKISILLLLCSVAFVNPTRASDEERKAYIVYMGSLVENEQSVVSDHIKLLQQVVDARYVKQSLVRSYTRSFNGFVAYLTPQEHQNLARHEEVVSIFPSTSFQLHTTRSWDFMKLTQNAKRNPTVESDTIIGVIDTGIWPESQSFNDQGFGPPPKKWKGACKGGNNFTCNNKIIGARFYDSKVLSARDTDGHGSHVASTAAGIPVKDANFFGIANGTARGGVPSARIAAYKVCDATGCNTADILAAFDDAIADGVDLITISIGGTDPIPVKADVIAIGSLHAAQKRILVMQSAGNGASPGSVASNVPWIFSVGASSTDRGIITKVVIGNGTVLTGKSVNSFDLKGQSFPLAYGKDVTRKCDMDEAMDCAPDCLDPSLVKGKIVLCRLSDFIENVFEAGALGSVFELESYLPENLVDDYADVFPFIAAGLKANDFNVVESYFRSTKSSKVNILTSESIRNVDAPRSAGFSSKGPNVIIPDILKPDITAPGIEILAAYSPLGSPSDVEKDRRSVNYSVLSGTSMSCPHVAGAAAYVKSFHPDWSPSAIKSAIMTSAWKMDPRKDPLAEFAYGAGHIDPIKALDPGLVYETLQEDYVQLLCNLGFDSNTIRKIFGVNATCPSAPKTTVKDLNYPSMSSRIKTSRGQKSVAFSEKFRRTVTNVGSGKSTYKATTSRGPNYSVSVNPNVLEFGAANEKKSFEVMISGNVSNGKLVSASLEWSDGVHSVRSPVVIYPDNFLD